MLGKGNSVKSCRLAYSCNKCKGNCNIGIRTYPKDSLNTASATNLSSNSNNILLQTATAAVSNFNFPGSLINVQVTKNRPKNIVVNTFDNSKSTVKSVDIIPVQFSCGEKLL